MSCLLQYCSVNTEEFRLVDTDFSTRAVNPFKMEFLNVSRPHVRVSTNLKSFLERKPRSYPLEGIQLPRDRGQEWIFEGEL